MGENDKVVHCAWCGKPIEQGEAEGSHGICTPCGAKLMGVSEAEFEALVEKEKAKNPKSYITEKEKK